MCVFVAGAPGVVPAAAESAWLRGAAWLSRGLASYGAAAAGSAVLSIWRGLRPVLRSTSSAALNTRAFLRLKQPAAED